LTTIPALKFAIATITFGNLEKPIPFIVRQAHHERNTLIYLVPFALSLSKCRIFRDSPFYSKPDEPNDDIRFLKPSLLSKRRFITRLSSLAHISFVQ